MADKYDDPEYWRKPGEPLTSNTFDWLVLPKKELGFAVPVRSCLVDNNKYPITIAAVVDMNAKRPPPAKIFGQLFPVPANTQDYLREAIQKNQAHALPQKFELVIVDFGRPAEQWRRLQFFAMFEAAPVIRTGNEIAPEVVEQIKAMSHGEDSFSNYSAAIQLSVFGGIEKIGDWENKQALAAGPQTFDQKVESAGKRIWDIANFVVDGSIELVQNISRESDGAEKRKQDLRSRTGTFASAKPMPQLFEEVYKALNHPIGRLHWSLGSDTTTGEITGRCSWREEEASREITVTYWFKPVGNGTTIEYEYLVYESPLGSVFANQLIEITNGWIKSWAKAPG
jgi:hypothetical protein